MQKGWLKELVGDRYKSMSALGRALAKHPSVVDEEISQRTLGNKLSALNRAEEVHWWMGKGAKYKVPLASLLKMSIHDLDRHIAAATRQPVDVYHFEQFEDLAPFDCLNETLPPGYPKVFYDDGWSGFKLWTVSVGFDLQSDLIWTYAQANGWYCRQCEEVPEGIDSIRQPVLLEVKRQHIQDNSEWVEFIENESRNRVIICLTGDVTVDVKNIISASYDTLLSRLIKSNHLPRWVDSPPVADWFEPLCDWIEKRHTGHWSATDYQKALAPYARYFKPDLNHILRVLSQFDASTSWENNIRRWFTVHIERIVDSEEQLKLEWFRQHGFGHLAEFKRQQMLTGQVEQVINEEDQLELIHNAQSVREAIAITKQWSDGIDALWDMMPTLMADRAFNMALTTFVLGEMSIVEQAKVLFWPEYAGDVLFNWIGKIEDSPTDLQDFLNALEQADEMTQMLGINALFRICGLFVITNTYLSRKILMRLWDTQMTARWLFEEEHLSFVHVCVEDSPVGRSRWWHTALLLISYELKDFIAPSFYCPWNADEQTKALWNNIQLCRGWPVGTFDVLGGWLWKHDIEVRFYDDPGWQDYEIVMFWLTGQAQEDVVASQLPDWGPDLERLEAAAKRHSLELDDVLSRLWPYWLSRKQLSYGYPFIDSVSTEDRQRLLSLLDPGALTDGHCEKLIDSIQHFDSTDAWSEALWMRVSQSKNFDLYDVERYGVPLSVVKDMWLREQWDQYHWKVSKLLAEQLSAQQLDTWIEQYQNQYPWRVLRLVQYAEFSVCLQWYERWLPVWSDDRDTFDKHLKSIKSSLFYIFNHQNRDQSAAKAFELYRSYFTD